MRNSHFFSDRCDRVWLFVSVTLFVSLVFCLVTPGWASLSLYKLELLVLRTLSPVDALQRPALLCFVFFKLRIFAYKDFYFATFVSRRLLGPNSAPHVTLKVLLCLRVGLQICVSRTLSLNTTHPGLFISHGFHLKH